MAESLISSLIELFISWLLELLLKIVAEECFPVSPLIIVDVSKLHLDSLPIYYEEPDILEPEGDMWDKLENELLFCFFWGLSYEKLGDTC